VREYRKCGKSPVARKYDGDGENATDVTVPVCPVKGPAAVSPVFAFQTRIDRSERA
jgi:hypothetical protein